LEKRRLFAAGKKDVKTALNNSRKTDIEIARDGQLGKERKGGAAPSEKGEPDPPGGKGDLSFLRGERKSRRFEKKKRIKRKKGKVR